MKVVLRAAYDDFDDVSRETAFDCSVDPHSGEVLESMTQQSFKEECDINEIVRRFGLTGQLPENVSVPVSGDFTGITDFKSAMDAVAKAQSDFMALPADLRAQFDNDPQKLMTFMADDKNRAKAEELGLVNKPPEQIRTVVQAVDELAGKIVPLVK